MAMRGIAAAAAALGLMGLAAGAALADDIVIPIDMTAPMRLAAPAEGVAIGNPSIAGVSVQNERLLFITGRAYGATNLVVVGHDGRTIFNGRVIVTPSDEGLVTVHRGAESSQLACQPGCRPRPDIGDSRQSYQAATEQITGRASTAGN
ncbi:MAG: pilus assembly protein CpaC [Alphaproteobacteria bacterium]|nr:pilus assembly protein CpaC [Alphaproteobacteria bacterium]